MLERRRLRTRPADHTRRVEAYYDGATRYFVRWGRGISSIHRGLWAPGVQTAEAATDTIHQLVADALRPGIREVSEPHIVDLGCGVGATATRLTELLGARTTGITLSGEQVRIARERTEALGLAERCRFERASFLAPPPLAPAHGAVAIESFVHGDDPARFFVEAARALVPGARLVVADDVLGPNADDPRAAPVLDRFRRGWRVATLLSPADIDAHARAAGFELESDRDLTSWVWIGRPRDRVLSAVAATLGRIRVLERWPVWGSWVGGDALQTGLRKRWIQHRLLVWTRRDGAGVAG